MRTITIGVKHPGQPWTLWNIEDSLRTYQKIVGGLIEHFERSESGIEFFCNEEGKLLGLAPNVFSLRNQDMICGPIFAVRTDEEGEFTSLTNEDIADLLALSK